MIPKNVKSMYAFAPSLFSLEVVSRTSVIAILLNTQATEQNSYGSFSITLWRSLFCLANTKLESAVFLLYPVSLFQLTNQMMPSVLVFNSPSCSSLSSAPKKEKKKRVVLFWSARPLDKASARQISLVISPPSLRSLHPISLLSSISVYLYIKIEASVHKRYRWASPWNCVLSCHSPPVHTHTQGGVCTPVCRSQVCWVWTLWFKLLQLLSVLWHPWSYLTHLQHSIKVSVLLQDPICLLHLAGLICNLL